MTNRTIDCGADQAGNSDLAERGNQDGRLSDQQGALVRREITEEAARH